MSTSLVLVGVGGQGVIMASQIIGKAALEEGRDVIMSEVHGMAQRGGVVVCTIKLDESNSALVGDGGADYIVGFEPVETYRAMHTANPGTQIVSNLASIYPFTVNVGKESYPEVETLVANMEAKTDNLHTLNARELAQEAGHTITENVVMMGAMCALPGFPMKEEAIKEAVKRTVPEKFMDMNMRAFELGVQAVREG